MTLHRTSHAVAIALTVLALLLPPAVGRTADAPAGAAPTAKATARRKAAKPLANAEPAATGPATPPADSSPLAELKKSNAALKKVLQKQAPNWSPERDVRNAEVRKVVGGFLDFEELSRRALAKHWEKLTPVQRVDFVQTLRDLVERNYVSQIHGQPDYDLKFEKERKTDGDASVNATLSTVARKKKVKVALEYKLIWKNGRWVVYDVVTDDQSLIENYRAEFNKIINKEGFDALLKRMKKKLADKPQ